MALHLGSVVPDFTQDSTEGPIQLPRVDWRRLGGPVFAPEGFHAGLHHRARHGRQVKSEFDKRDVKVIALSVNPTSSHTRSWIGDIEETQGYQDELPDPRRPRSEGRNLYGMIHPEATTRSRCAQSSSSIRTRRSGDDHLPGEHRPQLRRDPARDRPLQLTDSTGRDARQLEGWRRLRDRASITDPEVIKQKISRRATPS